MKETQSDISEIEEESQPGCCHHWMIQPASGPVSDGACQVCGETREFKNYVGSPGEWGESRTIGQRSSNGKKSTKAGGIERNSDDEDINDQDPFGGETNGESENQDW